VTATEMICPRCGRECGRDEADVGVGIMYGPCGWSEWERYDTTAGPKFEGRYQLDSRGGMTPIDIEP
jgi:hypothetical protein